MLYEDNYLMHHGIKGQRWGIRRFQNEDGTLTAEGRERYYGNEYDRKAKKGEFDNNPELREIYIQEKTEKKESQIKQKALNGGLLSDKEMKALDTQWKKISGDSHKIDNKIDEILKKNDAYSKVKDESTFSKEDQNALSEMRNQINKNRNAIAETFYAKAKANEARYAQEIQKESDKTYVDPSYLNFKNKSDKAEAEAAYLNKMILQDPPETNDDGLLTDNSENTKWEREVGHLYSKVWDLSINGYDGVPKSERQKEMYNYVDTDDVFECYDNYQPKYEQSDEWKQLQSERQQIKDKVGYDKAQKDFYGYAKADHLDDPNADAIFDKFKDSWIKAQKKYSENTKNISSKESAIKNAFNDQIIKNTLLDMGYEITPRNMELISYIIWAD